MLAEFGADVVKVDGRAPSVTEAFWIDTNRGKRSLVVDLKTEGGREILWKLLESADVVVENFRQGVAERLGFGYHQVSARLPRLIYASMNAYGYAGSMAAWPGWEQLAQAATGMQVRFGGRNGKPQTVHYAVNDYASGLALSFGVMGALREREHTGRGQRVVTSLAATAGLLQSLYMFDYPGYERCEIEGQTVTGTGPLSRIYACADGWIYFHCPKRAWPSVVRAPELAGLALGLAGDLSGGFPAEVTSAFEQRLREGSADSWVHCLNANGATAVRLHSPDELLDSPALRAAGLITTSQSPHLGRIEHVGIPHQLSLTPARTGCPAPALGGDTIEILRELGYPDLQIGRWFGERVIAAYAR